MGEVRSSGDNYKVLKEVWPTLGEPFNTRDTMQGFGILKPYGYAGDFEMIDRIYTRWVSPRSELVSWDEYFHHQKATSAVRNRKKYFLGLLDRMSPQREQCPIEVLSVGCGSARECKEWLDKRDGAKFDLLDRDNRALAYALRLNKVHEREIRPISANAFRFNSTTRYDLIWAAGLFDYLPDEAFKKLVRHLLQFLKPDGLLTIGNFSPKNPTRDYMEFGHWFLHYRSEEQLYQLASDEGRTAPNMNICVDHEPEDINLFLHLSRPS